MLFDAYLVYTSMYLLTLALLLVHALQVDHEHAFSSM